MFSGKRFSAYIGLSLLAICIVWLIMWGKETLSGAVMSSALQTASSLYATLMLIRNYRKSNKEAKLFMYYGLGMSCYTIAQICWTVVTLTRNAEPNYVGFPEVMWILQYGFYIIAVYHQYQQRIRRSSLALGFTLEILLLTTVAATLYWKLQIEPLISEHDYRYEIIGVNLFVSSACAVMVFLLLFLSLYGRKSAASFSNFLFIMGFLTLLLGNTMFLHLLPGTDAGHNWSWITDFCWFLGTLLIGFAALPERHWNAPPPLARSIAKAIHFVKRYGLIVVASAALIVVICSIGTFTIISAGAIVTIVLLSIRLSVGIYEVESTGTALRQSDFNYRNFVESSLFGVFIEQQGRLVYVNRHGEQIFGCQPGEMIGRPLANYIAPADRELLIREFAAVTRPNHTSRFEVAARKSNQTELYVEMQAAAAFYEGRPAISGTLLDVTESKLSEQRLIRSEKLSVIGQLAAGVAHEIRNPLTALKGFTQLLHRTADRNRNYYDMMLTELERINYIVGEFMLLSKPHQWQQLMPCNLVRLLEDIVPIMQSQAIITNVTIQVGHHPDLPNVLCDVNQIKQVLINLMKNAIEAMPGGGVLDVQFMEEDLGQVGIAIIDHGVGIPQEVIERLGEPFYTTKESGTGLGLTVCFKIIQAHGGMLTLSSEPDKGTTATIRLPAEQSLEQIS